MHPAILAEARAEYAAWYQAVDARMRATGKPRGVHFGRTLDTLPWCSVCGRATKARGLCSTHWVAAFKRRFGRTLYERLHRDHVRYLAYWRDYRASHRVTINATHRRYRERHRAAYNERQRERLRRRRAQERAHERAAVCGETSERRAA